MANLSQQKRERMLKFLETIKAEHTDDESIIALNEIENELNSKKYGLVWEQHEEAVDIQMRTHVPVFTEVPEREIHANPKDEGYNFLLEGDNLHSLKLLEKTHKGKIDVIYIDPPYNTKNKDFIYNDSIVDELDSFRHSKWLSFMSERLRLAYNLLSIKGVIFISIDDREYANLKLLCDEIFGEQNCVTTLVWEKKKKGTFLSNEITNIKEYVLAYCKNKPSFGGLIGEINEETETYPCINASNKREVRHIKAGIKSNYREKNYILKAGSIVSNNTMSIKYLTDLVIENGIVKRDFDVEGNWRYSDTAMSDYSQKGELYITTELYIRRIVSEPRYKTLKDILPRVGTDSTIPYNAPIEHNNLMTSGWGSNEDADNEIIELFGKQRVFSYPKPVRLIKKLLVSTRIDNALVLDFFAGTGTTGQAVAELNSEDKSNRHFILCTNNENEICENVTYERIKKVSEGYSDKKSIPVNLKYFKTAFILKNSDDDFYSVEEELTKHIKEMIELERGISIDDERYMLILTDDDADSLEKKPEKLKNCKAVYISGSVFLTRKQEALLDGIETITIPQYYFEDELMEVGEL